jgi:DNA polymerase/3'-5' exonuclease PolX
MSSTLEDKRELIIQNLKILKLQENANKQPFKARAYAKVIKHIEEYAGEIKSIEDVNGIDGIGDRIRQKIQEILEKGFIERTKDALKDVEKHRAEEALALVMSIGTVKAKQLVEKGITSIEDLREKVKKNPTILNEKQKLGLCYHDDFIKRIPRAEMDKHNDLIHKMIKDVNPEIVCQIMGSYRRGVATSGDIDVLLTHPKNDVGLFSQIIDSMREKYLVNEFAYGVEKYLGICKLPRHKTFRRIDIMYIPPEQFPFAMLYFTGSQEFNIEMRNLALEKGYSLSEHGFKYSAGPNKGKFLVHHGLKTEKDVFEFLEIKYVEPFNRAKGMIVKV